MTPDEVLRLQPSRKHGDGLSERIVAPGQMLIFVSGHFPILGTQMLYFLDPVLNARATLPPPAELLAIQKNHGAEQAPAERTPNRISRAEILPATNMDLTIGERCFLEELGNEREVDHHHAEKQS
jgi:type IV secretion system protein VirD4